MNKVIITGNLTKDIDVMATQSGNQVVSNALGVRRNYKNAQGEYDTDFIPFVAWGETKTQYLKMYVKKGDLLEIIGSWGVRSYEDKQGIKHRVDEVIVEEVRLLLSPKREEKKEEESFKYKDVDFNHEDLPF